MDCELLHIVRGASPMTRAAFGMLILTTLSMPGCSGTAGGVDIWKAVEANDAAAIEKYAKAGGDVNIRNWGGSTPLWVALDEKKRDSYEALLKHGANPNIVMRGNRVVTHWAALAIDDSWWLKLALENGADPNLGNADSGRPGDGPPLFFVLSAGEVGESEVAIEKVKLLVEHGADVNKPGRFDCYPLADAAAQTKFKIVLYLLEHGADIKKSQHMGITFLERIRQEYKHKDRFLQKDDQDNLAAVCTWLEAHGVKIEEEED